MASSLWSPFRIEGQRTLVRRGASEASQNTESPLDSKETERPPISASATRTLPECPTSRNVTGCRTGKRAHYRNPVQRGPALPLVGLPSWVLRGSPVFLRCDVAVTDRWTSPTGAGVADGNSSSSPAKFYNPLVNGWIYFASLPDINIHFLQGDFRMGGSNTQGSGYVRARRFWAQPSVTVQMGPRVPPF